MSGKGDIPRPYNKTTYDREYTRIFKKPGKCRLAELKKLVEERKKERERQ